MIQKPLLFAMGLFLLQCQGDQTVYVGTGKDVMVTLNLADKERLLGIWFVTNYEKIEVSKEELDAVEQIVFGFNCEGEGEYSLCVQRDSDTICAGGYVENGYRPELEWTGLEIWTTSFGVGY